MKNIFDYVCDKEKTETRLIDGKNCMAESAQAEFEAVKRQFHKTGGRQYYHIIQSFSPRDRLTPETAHKIGLEFAEYFKGFQALVVTHKNKQHLHNHIVLNSVNFETGKMFHQSATEMALTKEYSNRLCEKYGLSKTEVKADRNRIPQWKQHLRDTIQYALDTSYTKDAFLDTMRMHGYGVKWDDEHKYITYTTPEGYKCRDAKLFDERYLKENMEIYFAMGGCDTRLSLIYNSYTPQKEAGQSSKLIGLLTDLLAAAPPCPPDFEPEYSDWHSEKELIKLRSHGLRVSEKSFWYYSSLAKEKQEMGMYF